MEKKIYQIFAIISLLTGSLSAFFVDWETQWVFPIALFVAAFFFILAARSLKNAVFLIILFLPYLFNFNYLKVNLSFLTHWLGIADPLINLSAALYLFLIFLFFISLIVERKKIIKAPLFPVLILMIAFFSISILWSDFPQISFTEAVLFATPLIAYLLTFQIIKDQEDFFQLIFVLFFSAALPVLLGFFQIAAGSYFYEPDSLFGRIAGPFHHPNNFGLYLFVIMSMAILFLRTMDFGKNSNIVRNMAVIFLIPLGVMFIFTYSRTSWISLLVFVFLLSLRKPSQFFKTVAFVALIFSSLLFFEAPRERMAGIYERSLYDSVYVREGIFKIAAQKALEKPFSGYGIGTFEEVVRSVKETYDSSSFPHNDFILFALEGGLIGIILFVAYSAQLIYHATISYRQSPKAAEEKHVLFGSKFTFHRRLFGRGILFLVLAIFVTSIAEATFKQTVMQIIFWMLIGGWFAFNALQQKKEAA